MSEQKPKSNPADFLIVNSILPLFPKFIRPNHITIVRILLAPLVMWLFWQKNYAWGLALFLFTALTDALDGAMARHRNQITKLGKFLDPVADKLLIGLTLLVLIIQHINLWVVYLVFLFEFAFFFGGLIYLVKGREAKANWWGKIKMILHVLAIVVLLIGLIFHWPLLLISANMIFVFSIFFAFMSLITYGI